MKSTKPRAAAAKPAPAHNANVPAPSAGRLNARLLRLTESSWPRGAALKAASAEYRGFSEMDMSAVIGLVDLFRFAEHVEAAGACWLGRFIHDVLLEVSAEGASAVVNNPKTVVKSLNESISDFERDLSEAREMANQYRGYQQA